MHFDIRKKRQEFEDQEPDLLEHAEDFLDNDDLEEEEWSALAIQAGYDGVFDEYYNVEE